MVAFTRIFALVGLFVSMAVANPVAEPEDAITEFKSEFTALEVSDNEKRQSGVRCTAIIGLGPPSNPLFCGSVQFVPNAQTVFFPTNTQFPNCKITAEIDYPDCDAYRVTDVVNCGGERYIDISGPNAACRRQ